MIEKMKKVQFLLTSGDSDKYLSEFQQLGLVHLQTKSVSEHPDIIALLSRMDLLKKTLAALLPYSELSGSEETHETLSIDKVQKQTSEILLDIQRHRSDIERLKKEEAALAPWGYFSLTTISDLEEQGILISLHILPKKAFQKAQHTNRHFEIIQENKVQVRFVEIRRAKSDENIETPLYPEERMGDMDDAELRLRLETHKNKISELEFKLRILSRSKRAIESELRKSELRLERLIAAKSLDSHANGYIQCLSGFVPISLFPELDSFLEDRNILPIYGNPGDYEAPIRLKNGVLVRLFEPITKIFGLPQYMEIDPTPFFAPFFAFFFGFCLADLGYGIIVIISALAALLFVKRRAFKPIAALAAIFGFCTVIGGLFLNTFFGTQIDAIPNLSDEIASFLLFRDINDAMYFSILLGIIQILVGFIIQIANKWRQEGLIACFQPLGTFLLLAGVVLWVLGTLEPSFAIGPIQIGSWGTQLGTSNRIGFTLSITGILLILLFNDTRKRIWLRPLLGLWKLYGIATDIPRDILSYIRLFGLSLAGGLLGGAINSIAIMILGTDPGFLSWVFALIVLLAGHSVNFALAALGAFVHPLRLTFVEFYRAVGFRGGGIKYAPFGGKFA
ncbi:hypothetical protein JY97_17005 [Alkalispirochaeta odontotermitis]|nr:hypothetical protein JY97_17005 [Alkalispirochaeta odontotermitis]